MLTNRPITQLHQQNSKQISATEKHNSALGEQSENNCHKSILRRHFGDKNCRYHLCYCTGEYHRLSLWRPRFDTPTERKFLMNFAKSDQVHLQRTKILSSKKGQFGQIKNNENNTLKTLLQKTQNAH